MTRSSLVFNILLVASLASGCNSAPDFGVALTTTPAAPIPDKEIGLKVTLSGADSAGATIKVVVGGKTFDVPRAEGSDFTTDKLVLPGVGNHAVTVNVTVDGETIGYTATLSATCGTNGGVGAACCAPEACSNGLTCVYGACAVAPAVATAKCHGNTECASQVCSAGACAAATCDDKVKNGGEANVDCGGTCAGCATGATCDVDSDCAAGICAQGVCPLPAGKLIGEGDAATNKAKITQILDQGMKAPTDIAFSTLDPNQMWIVDAPTDSFIVVFGAGKEGQTYNVLKDYSEHFMEHVMAISFSNEPTFGTCGDSNNDYNGKGKANNFMGPVQWPSNYNDYTKVNSAHSVHWDMLHSSPNCMGIAAAGGRAYYMFNGFNNSIDWVDFKEPHCPGCDDHSDGVKRRFAGVKVKRVPYLPSNLVFDKETSWLYVADSGNGRVLRLDTRNSTPMGNLPGFFGDGTLTEYSAPVVQELAATGLKMPSGLAYDRGVLYVGDAETGVITAWKVDDMGANGGFGKKIATLKTGFKPNGLVGLTVGPDRKLYAVDRVGAQVVRVDP